MVTLVACDVLFEGFSNASELTSLLRRQVAGLDMTAPAPISSQQADYAALLHALPGEPFCEHRLCFSWCDIVVCLPVVGTVLENRLR